MAANILNVENFDPAEWKIGREGRQWKGAEFDRRIYQAPEKIEYVGGILIEGLGVPSEEDMMAELTLLTAGLRSPVSKKR